MRKEQPKISVTSESSKRGSMRNESLEGEFNTLTSVMEEYSSTADLRSFICLPFCKRTYTTQDQLEFCFYFSATNLEAEANKILQDFWTSVQWIQAILYIKWLELQQITLQWW